MAADPCAPIENFDGSEIVEIDFHRILALGGACRRLLKLRNVVAWEKLAYAVAAPDLVNPSIENLTWIKVERDLDRLAGFYIFQILLEKCCQHITVGVRDKRRNASHPDNPGHMPGRT